MSEAADGFVRKEGVPLLLAGNFSIPISEDDIARIRVMTTRAELLQYARGTMRLSSAQQTALSKIDFSALIAQVTRKRWMTMRMKLPLPLAFNRSPDPLPSILGRSCPFMPPSILP
jgi:hypothetical protein